MNSQQGRAGIRKSIFSSTNGAVYVLSYYSLFQCKSDHSHLLVCAHQDDQRSFATDRTGPHSGPPKFKCQKGHFSLHLYYVYLTSFANSATWCTVAFGRTGRTPSLVTRSGRFLTILDLSRKGRRIYKKMQVIRISSYSLVRVCSPQRQG